MQCRGPRWPSRFRDTPGSLELRLVDAVDRWIPWVGIRHDQGDISGNMADDEDVVLPDMACTASWRDEANHHERDPQPVGLAELLNCLGVRSVGFEPSRAGQRAEILLEESRSRRKSRRTRWER
jgi:hypothetical protein